MSVEQMELFGKGTSPVPRYREVHVAAHVRRVPCVRGSDTSEAAAAAAAKSVARKRADQIRQRERVRVWFVGQGARGGTDEECQRALRMNPAAQRLRRIELVNAGVLREHPEGRKRRTSRGRHATVWVADDAAAVRAAA